MALGFAGLPAVPAAKAQGIDLTQGGPIHITAQDGIQWRQSEKVVIANGDARAVRGNVTVTGDRLFAWYRPKASTDANQPPAAGQLASTVANRPLTPVAGKPATPGANQPVTPAAGQPAATGLTGEEDTEGNEVYRMRAEGNVHIFTPTDQAWGDQATYDLDDAVMVMTGNGLKLTTPSDTVTARDTLEYWSLKHMAVARGDAVLVTNDGRRISADTMVAYTVANNAASPSASAGPAPAPAATEHEGQKQNATGDPLADMAGHLERAEAFDNVTVRTQTDIVTGDRGVYVPDTGVAHLGGHVRITRGLNQVNGSEAVVNMKTGIATLLSGDSGRVTGLVVPNDQSAPPPAAIGQNPPPPGGGPTGHTKAASRP
jgi:lipopolysaccharide export system protein LptA